MPVAGWKDVGRVEGGFQGGVVLVENDAGQGGVLKEVRRTSWDEQQWEATSRLLDQARARGWPTPGWIDWGLRDGGGAFVVFEHVQGAMPTKLTDELCSALLAVIELQHNLRPSTIQTWTRYPAQVVSDELPYRSAVRDFSASGASIVRRIDQSCAGCDFDVGSDDLVHGDFSLDNVLVESDVVTAVVDVLAVGKGHRVVDVASLLRQCWAWHSNEPSCRRMVDAGAAMVGTDAFRVAVASRVIDVLCFGIDHWPSDLDKLVERFHGLLDFIDA